jgi:hypothetical protein
MNASQPTPTRQAAPGPARALASFALRPLTGAVELGWRTASRAADDAALAALDALLASRLFAELVERASTRMLEGPELERIVDALLESPMMETLVGRAIESRLLDTAIERLLEGDALWRLVEEVARSPAVTEAIAHQGFGFADQVAGGVKERSRSADAWLERAVKRALRRSSEASFTPAGQGGPGAV